MMRSLLILSLTLGWAQVQADDALWARLKSESGLVVLMRHTQAGGGNPLSWDESGGCAGESMLTPQGRAHARKIGEEFARRGIKPTVISSPMCRTRDTARIAFEKEPLTDAALREVASADPSRKSAFERKAQSLIAGSRGASPVVFVNHRPNIEILTFELVEAGELLVARVNAHGELEVLGKLDVRR